MLTYRTWTNMGFPISDHSSGDPREFYRGVKIWGTCAHGH